MLAVHWGAEAMLMSPEHCEHHRLLRQRTFWPVDGRRQAAKGALLYVEHQNSHPARCEIVLFRSLVQKYLLSLCFFFFFFAVCFPRGCLKILFKRYSSACQTMLSAVTRSFLQIYSVEEGNIIRGMLLAFF